MKRLLLIFLAGTLPAAALLGYWYLPARMGPGRGLTEFDDWEIATMHGQRIGSNHTTVTRASEDGRTVIKAAESMQMSIKRDGQDTKMAIDCRDTETSDGRLIDFEATMGLGNSPMRTTGKVVANRLEIEMESQGKTLRQSLDWPVDAGGFLAPILSLRTAPLKPGERRSVKHLNFDGQVHVTEFVAEKEEPVDLWKGSEKLLKVGMIEHVISNLRDTNQDLKSTIWINSSGDVLKSVNEQLGAAYYRVPRDVAVAPTEATFDLMAATEIKIDRPIPHIHDAKSVRYRIHLDGGDAAAAFPAGPSQEVKRIDEHTAEVTVRAIRPDKKEVKPSPTDTPNTDAPTADDLAPNNYIQSDDPLIVAQAKEAVGSETDPWKQAVALEAYVHRVMDRKEFFSQAFATAAEAAKTHKGDCKAHAVYLAALARSLKIPARVAVGLVYVQKPESQVFGGHMWTEVCIDGRWIGLDATLGRGGLGGGHLKVSQNTLAHGSALDFMLAMLKVIGRLKIEVLDSE
jgi:transglutaminase-like putative cysteine protease